MKYLTSESRRKFAAKAPRRTQEKPLVPRVRDVYSHADILPNGRCHPLSCILLFLLL